MLPLIRGIYQHQRSVVVSFALLAFGVFMFIQISSGDIANSAVNTDAIAMRVIPNKGHLSAERWYQEKQFGGSPQSLMVDGYEAVRDGRTVYVNAANVNGIYSNNDLYTNIYVLSYNQQAENATMDIFGQLLKHWKFNANLGSSEAGQCSIASATTCVYDADCPADNYCLSLKAKIIRDTKRLADLADMNSYLETYQRNNSNHDYPKLPSGSYVAGATVSRWPSWQENLGSTLNRALPLDPINQFTSCSAGFDTDTCWNQGDKRFAFSFATDPSISNAIVNSKVYWYKDGKFHINIETGYNNLLNETVNASAPRTNLTFQPALKNIQAPAKREYKYDISVIDPSLANPNLYNLAWDIEDENGNDFDVNQIRIEPSVKVKNHAIIIIKLAFNNNSEAANVIPVKVIVADNRMDGDQIMGAFTITVAPRCGNNVQEGPYQGKIEACDGVGPVSATPANAACQADCGGWTCTDGHPAGTACESNIMTCDVLDQGGNKIGSGKKVWDGQAWPADCTPTTCEETKGYHLAGAECVLCQADNAASVKWENNTCQAVSCNNQTLDTGFHVDPATEQCRSNYIEDNCPITGATKTFQYWDSRANGGQGDWGDCQPKECNNAAGYYNPSYNCVYCGLDKHFDVGPETCVSNYRENSCQLTGAKTTFQNWDYNANNGGGDWGGCRVKECNSAENYYLSGSQCVQCGASQYFDPNQKKCLDNQTRPCPIANGTGEQKWENGGWSSKCTVKSCDSLFHINYAGDGCTTLGSEVCKSDTVINGAMKSTWLGTAWGSCLAASVNSKFPYCFNGTHPEYPNQKVCVNACGSVDNTITLTDVWRSKDKPGCFVNNMKSIFRDNGNKIIAEDLSNSAGEVSVDINIADLAYSLGQCKFILEADPTEAAPGNGCVGNEIINKTDQFKQCVTIPYNDPKNWDTNAMPLSYFSPPDSCFATADVKLFSKNFDQTKVTFNLIKELNGSTILCPDGSDQMRIKNIQYEARHMMPGNISNTAYVQPLWNKIIKVIGEFKSGSGSYDRVSQGTEVVYNNDGLIEFCKNNCPIIPNDKEQAQNIDLDYIPSLCLEAVTFPDKYQCDQAWLYNGVYSCLRPQKRQGNDFPNLLADNNTAKQICQEMFNKNLRSYSSGLTSSLYTRYDSVTNNWLQTSGPEKDMIQYITCQ